MIYLFSSASLYLMQCNSSHSLPSHKSEVKYFPTRTRFYLYTKFKFTSCRVSNSPTGEEHKPLSIPSLSLFSNPKIKISTRRKYLPNRMRHHPLSSRTELGNKGKEGVGVFIFHILLYCYYYYY